MSNFTTLANACNLINRNQAKYWKLYDSDGNLIDSQIDGIELSESISLFQESVAGMLGEYVQATCSKTKLENEAGERGGNKRNGVFKFKILLENAGPQKEQKQNSFNSQLNPMSGAGGFQMYHTLMEKITALQIENQQKDFQRQLDELKDKGKKSKADTALELILAKILSSDKGGAGLSGVTQQEHTEPAINGVTQAQTTVSKGDAVNDLKNSLNALKSVDSNFIDSLQALAKFAQANPEAYKQYLQMLKSQ